MAKTTRQKAEERLIAISANKDLILNSGCIKEEKYILERQAVEKGENIKEYYCQECGQKYKGKSGYYAHESCPNCGNSNFENNGRRYYYGGGRYSSNSTLNFYASSAENGFEILAYHTNISFSQEENMEDVKNTIGVEIRYSIMFDNESGWYVYDAPNKKLMKRDCEDERKVLEYVRKTKPVNTPDFDFDSALVEAEAFDKKRVIANQKKRANSKASIIEELRSSYKPKPVDEEKIMNCFDGIVASVYSKRGDSVELLVGCGKCGSVNIVNKTDDKVTCPTCGNTHDCAYYHNGGGHSSAVIAIYENTNLPENDLLIRLFKVVSKISVADGFTRNVVEYMRVFAGKKLCVYNLKNFNYYNNIIPSTMVYDKGTIRDIENHLYGRRYRYSSDVGNLIQEDEEIVQVIKNSCLANSGLIECYGMGNKAYKGFEKAPSMAYLSAWYKNPSIELVLKANMIAALERYVNEPSHLGHGSTLAEALCVKPRVAKMAAKMNLSRDDISDLSALYNADNNITQELFIEIKQARLPVHNIVSLYSNYGVSYAQTLKYLETVYNHQCIEKMEALGIWADYLRMAKATHIDLTDKARLYPGSLKKEHDVAVFAYRAIQHEMNLEQFKSQAEENAYYEYTYKDLMVVVPRTPEAIVEEATKQKNCLRSYIERVKNGDTVVAFIRRKEFPDDTYVTVEINNGSLVQLKGYCNSNPRNLPLMEFVQHWSRAKGIRMSC